MPAYPPPRPPALPVVDREYHEFWRAPGFRWWKGLLALLMGGVVWFLVVTVLSLLGVVVDLATGVTTMADYSNPGAIKVTPMLFLANNLGLAAAIPVSSLTAWACTGQRPGWLSSVTGRLRWGWLGFSVLLCLPSYLVILVLQFVGGTDGLKVNSNTVFMIVVIALTTPLQCAGEEFLMRGLLTRVLGGWLPRVAGLLVGAIVSAGVFMVLHNAADPWLNSFYVVFALTSSYLVWRTGGLEASIALHVVNNLVSMATLPFSDFSGMFDRQAGTADPSGMMIQFGTMAIAVGLILWQSRQRRLQRAAAPAAAPPPLPFNPWQVPGFPGWYAGPVAAPAQYSQQLPQSDAPAASAGPSTPRTFDE